MTLRIVCCVVSYEELSSATKQDHNVHWLDTSGDLCSSSRLCYIASESVLRSCSIVDNFDGDAIVPQGLYQ